jgi:hypothetical protein
MTSIISKICEDLDYSTRNIKTKEKLSQLLCSKTMRSFQIFKLTLKKLEDNYSNLQILEKNDEIIYNRVLNIINILSKDLENDHYERFKWYLSR